MGQPQRHLESGLIQRKIASLTPKFASLPLKIESYTIAVI